MKTHSLNPKTTRVYYELIAPDSTKVLDGYKDLTLDMRREDTVRIMQVVPRSQMWSAGQPNLYTLIVKTRFEGRINEYVPVKVGFRTVAADKGRLLVNGEPAELRVKEFEAEPQSGELDTLRKLGYNTLRLPAGRLSRELLNRCDSMSSTNCRSTRAARDYRARREAIRRTIRSGSTPTSTARNSTTTP